VYSNHLGARDSRIATAKETDAVPRPSGLQKDPGVFASNPPEFWVNMARSEAMSAS
jgi:hypothetical protein